MPDSFSLNRRSFNLTARRKKKGISEIKDPTVWVKEGRGELKKQSPPLFFFFYFESENYFNSYKTCLFVF